jgi:hypothetical protein
MNRPAVFFLLATLVATAMADTLSTLPDADSFCAGHVAGQGSSGKPGPHIVWRAYASPQSLESVTAHYRRIAGDEDPATRTWQVKEGGYMQTIRVYPASAPGPWDICQVPASAKSVILLSSLIK